MVEGEEQSTSQPSPGTALPSSQVSGGVAVPSPQTVTKQVVSVRQHRRQPRRQARRQRRSSSASPWRSARRQARPAFPAAHAGSAVRARVANASMHARSCRRQSRRQPRAAAPAPSGTASAASRARTASLRVVGPVTGAKSSRGRAWAASESLTRCHRPTEIHRVTGESVSVRGATRVRRGGCVGPHAGWGAGHAGPRSGGSVTPPVSFLEARRCPRRSPSASSSTRVTGFAGSRSTTRSQVRPAPPRFSSVSD